MDELGFVQHFDLVWKLEQRYSAVSSLFELQNLCYELEECLKSICVDTIVQLASQLFDNVKDTTHMQNFIISNDGIWYNVKAVPNLYDGRCLNIIISTIRDECKIIKIGTTNVSGTGQYSKINMYVAKELKVKKNSVLNLADTIFSVGYAWYRNKMYEYLQKESVSVAREVYTYLKNIFHNDGLYEKVWLAVVGKGYGFRLLNETQAEAALNTYGHNKCNISPNCYLVNLLSTRLPYQKLLMKEALNYDCKITADLRQADYTKSGDLYSLTLFNLYEGDAFSIYPLYKGEISLVALYPVEVKEAVESILEINKHYLKQVFLNRLKKIELAFLLYDETENVGFEEPSYSEIISVLDKCMLRGYIEKPIDLRETHVYNWLCACGLLEDKQNKYIVTEYARSVVKEGGNKVSMNIQLIQNNSGIATNGGKKNENIFNKSTLMNNGGTVKEAINEVRIGIKGQEEEEYVNNAMDMLEKEIKENKPRINLIKRILSSIEGISSIGDKLLHLKNILKLMFPI